MQNKNDIDTLSKEEWRSLVEEVDKRILSPHDRAKLVWSYLQPSDFNTWDLTCFCAAFLVQVSADIPFIKNIAKHLDITIHQWHYQQPDKLGLFNLEKEKENELREKREIGTEGDGVSQDNIRE